MAVQSLETFVIDIGDPDRPGRRLEANISYESYTNSIQTLSTNSVNAGSRLEGLLFVPSLLSTNPCSTEASQYVPENATRLSDIPIESQHIAFAPWTSPDCIMSYLTVVNDQVSAFIFYLPGQTTTDRPPRRNDEIWSLGDGGRWRGQSRFPVYAIPGALGAELMVQLAQYSDPTDYVRLFSTFTINGNTNLPTLWAFLLIVLGVVLVLVGLTSLSMHYIQRRHRHDLQRRVERGEVDLETLGIKRPRLTQADIDALPLIPYAPKEKKPPLPLPAISSETFKADSTIHPAKPPSPQDFNQPTCPICLEDYIADETLVRCLPCHHIYHPDCIDRYLLNTSSLCPICKSKMKSSSQQTGDPNFCPPITNAMVRRERHARRLRARAWEPSNSAGPLRRLETFRLRIDPVARARRAPIVHPPSLATQTPGQIEMGALTSPRSLAPTSPAGVETANPPEALPVGPERPPDGVHNDTASIEATRPPQDPERRREWARRRASALLGREEGVEREVEEEEGERRDGRGRWRKAMGNMFPGFR